MRGLFQDFLQNFSRPRTFVRGRGRSEGERSAFFVAKTGEFMYNRAYKAEKAGRGMQEKIIQVEGLQKSYGSVQAVRGITFDVERGTLFSFLGVNGAGKSTTINILCSILKKDAGKVRICGYDLDAESEKIKPRVGVVFQGSVLDDLLTVRENLTVRASYYGLYGGAWKARLGELVNLLALGEILERPYGKLSGGQRRRADIARGLLNRPELLVLDEPTTGLDPQTRKAVWEIMQRLQREEGMTVFLTTHYMEEADASDRVVILDGGKIAAEDTPVGLKNKYSQNTLYVYGEAGRLFEKLKERGVVSEKTNSGVKVICEDARQAKKFLAENGDLCEDFEFIKGNMDDVFLAVTGKRAEGGTY